MSSQEMLLLSKILHVKIHDVVYLVTKKVIHQIFDSYGATEVRMRKGSVVALVSFPSCMEAARARRDLQGRNIYDDCCWMQIRNKMEPSPVATTESSVDATLTPRAPAKCLTNGLCHDVTDISASTQAPMEVRTSAASPVTIPVVPGTGVSRQVEVMDMGAHTVCPAAPDAPETFQVRSLKPDVVFKFDTPCAINIQRQRKMMLAVSDLSIRVPPRPPDCCGPAQEQFYGGSSWDVDNSTPPPHEPENFHRVAAMVKGIETPLLDYQQAVLHSAWVSQTEIKSKLMLGGSMLAEIFLFQFGVTRSLLTQAPSDLLEFHQLEQRKHDREYFSRQVLRPPWPPPASACSFKGSFITIMMAICSREVMAKNHITYCHVGLVWEYSSCELQSKEVIVQGAPGHPIEGVSLEELTPQGMCKTFPMATTEMGFHFCEMPKTKEPLICVQNDHGPLQSLGYHVCCAMSLRETVSITQWPPLVSSGVGGFSSVGMHTDTTSTDNIVHHLVLCSCTYIRIIQWTQVQQEPSGYDLNSWSSYLNNNFICSDGSIRTVWGLHQLLPWSLSQVRAPISFSTYSDTPVHTHKFQFECLLIWKIPRQLVVLSGVGAAHTWMLRDTENLSVKYIKHNGENMVLELNHEQNMLVSIPGFLRLLEGPHGVVLSTDHEHPGVNLVASMHVERCFRILETQVQWDLGYVHDPDHTEQPWRLQKFDTRGGGLIMGMNGLSLPWDPGGGLHRPEGKPKLKEGGMSGPGLHVFWTSVQTLGRDMPWAKKYRFMVTCYITEAMSSKRGQRRMNWHRPSL